MEYTINPPPAGSNATALRPLFGGPIQCFIPDGFDDVSTVREIPDNQEVFTNPNIEMSIIIELNEFVETPNENAILLHFQELVDITQATDAQIVKVEQLGQNDVPAFGSDIFKAAFYGTYKIAKYNEEAKNTVNLYLALIRLPQVTTDVLISLNTATQVNPMSSSASHVTGHMSPEQTMVLFKTILHSFRIVDWSLFG